MTDYMERISNAVLHKLPGLLWGVILSPLRKLFFAEISLEMPVDFQRVANL